MEVKKEWNGVYYYKSNQAEIDFILDIRNDELHLEVGGYQYGYIDQLKAVVKGDTLGLYHYKNLSGMDYSDTRKYDFLKFYKASDGKFYVKGKLPNFPDGNIEFEKIK